MKAIAIVKTLLAGVIAAAQSNCRDSWQFTRWTQRNQSDASAIVGKLVLRWHGRQHFVQRIVQRLSVFRKPCRQVQLSSHRYPPEVRNPVRRNVAVCGN